MKRLVLSIILALAAATVSGSVFPDSRPAVFNRIDIRKGLSDNYSKQIAADCIGRIWILSASGTIDIYDGHSIRNVSVPDGIRPIRIVPAISGKNYLQTENSVLAIRGLSVKKASDLPDGTREVFSDTFLNPWFITSDEIVFRDETHDFPVALSGHSPIAFTSGHKKGTAYVIDSRHRLIEINAYRRSCRILAEIGPGLDRLSSSPGGILWIYGKSVYGLSRFDTANPAKGVSRVAACSSSLITDVRALDNGKILIGTNNDGLTVADSQGTPLRRMVHDSHDVYSLPSNHITSLLTTGTEIAVATTKSGICTAALENADIGSVDINIEEDICFFRFMPDGRMIVGTDGRGMLVFGKSDFSKPSQIFDTSNSPLASPAVIGAARMPGGDFLIGTYGGGLYRFDGNRLTRIFADNDSLRFVRHIICMPDSTVWAGTFSCGLFRLGHSSFNFSNSQLRTNCITALATLGDTLLAGTSTGLYIVAPRQGAPRDITAAPELATLTVNALAVDHRGLIWVGTKEGIRVYDRHFRLAGKLSVHSGLSDNTVRGIAEDKSGNIWVTGNNGMTQIAVYRRKGDYIFSASPFYDSDGIGDVTFNRYAIEALDDGGIIAGGLSRFITVGPRPVAARDISALTPVITALSVDGKWIDPGEALSSGTVPCEVPFNRLTTINLDNGQRLSLEISCLRFSLASHCRYEYSLDGDSAWTPVDGNRFALDRLPAGNHSLKLRVVGSPLTTDVMVSVARSRWLSLPAITAYCLIAIALVAGVRRIVIRRHKAAVSRQRLLQTLDRQDNIPLSADDIFLSKARDCIYRNLSDDSFGVEALSAAMSMSRSNLYKRINELTRKTPIEFIRLIRIREGKKILDSGESSVSQAAYSVGMSPKQFAKYFKEEYGMLPSRYVSSLKCPAPADKK